MPRMAAALALLIGVFLVLIVVVLLHPAPLPGDAGFTDAVRKTIGVLTATVGDATEAVLFLGPLVVIPGFLLFLRTWWTALWFAIAVVTSILVSGTIQLLLGKTSGGFPSVSVEIAVLTAALAVYLSWQRFAVARYWIVGLAAVEVVLTCVVLIDRVEHRPSEVLGGLIFGSARTLVAIAVADRWRSGRKLRAS
jgi:hypothetical protein